MGLLKSLVSQNWKTPEQKRDSPENPLQSQDREVTDEGDAGAKATAAERRATVPMIVTL